MNTDLLGFVLGCLGQRRYKLTEIAHGTGVPYETLKKIANGSTPNPGVRHVQRLADFFTEHAAPPLAEQVGPELVSDHDSPSATQAQADATAGAQDARIPSADPGVWPLVTDRRSEPRGDEFEKGVAHG